MNLGNLETAIQQFQKALLSSKNVNMYIPFISPPFSLYPLYRHHFHYTLYIATIFIIPCFIFNQESFRSAKSNSKWTVLTSRYRPLKITCHGTSMTVICNIFWDCFIWGKATTLKHSSISEPPFLTVNPKCKCSIVTWLWAPSFKIEMTTKQLSILTRNATILILITASFTTILGCVFILKRNILQALVVLKKHCI